MERLAGVTVRDIAGGNFQDRISAGMAGPMGMVFSEFKMDMMSPEVLVALLVCRFPPNLSYRNMSGNCPTLLGKRPSNNS